MALQLKRWIYASLTMFLLTITLLSLLAQSLPGVLRVEALPTGEVPTKSLEGITEPNNDTSKLLIELTGSIENKGRQIERMAERLGATGEEINYLIHIAWHESKFNTTVEPDTWVKYCNDGSWGEINADGSQFQCASGTKSKEKSFGLFQVLPSTAISHGCRSDWKANAYNQIDCALKVARGQGWNAWSTYWTYLD